VDKVEIQIAKESDFLGIIQVIHSHNKSSNIYFHPIPASDPVEIAVNNYSITFIAKQSNDTIAYLRLHSETPLMSENSEAEIEIVVAPEHQKRGIGGKLLRYAIQHAWDNTRAKCLKAKIKNDNIHSERLFQKVGFRRLYQDSIGSKWHLYRL